MHPHRDRHPCQMIHPRNSIQHLGDRVLSRTSPGFALYRGPVCPDGSPADRDGWCLIPSMPVHPICTSNLSFSGHLLLLLGLPSICVCICPHKLFPDPCLQLQLGCHPYMHPRDMLSPTALCLMFCHFLS